MADKKISDFSELTSLGGTEEVAGVLDTENARFKLSLLRSWLGAQGFDFSGAVTFDAGGFVVGDQGDEPATSAARIYNGSSVGLFVCGSGASMARFQRSVATVDGGQVHIMKSRGDYETPAAVHDGDELGSLYWRGHDGTSFVYAAQLAAEVAGTVSTGVVPATMTLRLMDAAGTRRDVIRWGVDGSVMLGTSHVPVFDADGFPVLPGYTTAELLAETPSAGRTARLTDHANNVPFVVGDGAIWRLPDGTALA